MNRIKRRVGDWWLPAALTIILYTLLSGFILVGYVPSESMEPTLPKNSIIIGTRNARTLAVGDIIVFRHEGILMVKRIAARAGDVVDLSQLEYMDYLPKPKREADMINVPEDCYFVLGDNTKNSLDSRYWEDPYVRSNQIVAKLFIH